MPEVNPHAAESALPMCVTGPYGPRVLSCGHREAGERASTMRLRGRHSYRLFGVVDGTVVLEVHPATGPAAKGSDAAEGMERTRTGAIGEHAHHGHGLDATSLPSSAEPAAGTGKGEAFGPGELLLLRPGEDVDLALSPYARLQFLVFDVIHQPTQGRLGQRKHAPPAQPQPQPAAVWGVSLPRRLPSALQSEAFRVLDAIWADYWRSVAGYARASAQLSLLLSDVVAFAAKTDPAGKQPRSRRDPLVGRVETLLRQSTAKLPSVAQLAQNLGVSREHLSRAFRQATGDTLRHVIACERWQRALRMLDEPTLPVRAIARQLGFSNAASFARAFRARFGRSPRAYRQERKASAAGAHDAPDQS